MPEIKTGDRVRATIEGTAACAGAWVDVKYLDFGGDPFTAKYLDYSAVELIPEPLKAGDTITDHDTLGGLPPTSVVRGDDEAVNVAQHDGSFLLAGDPTTFDAEDIALPVTVLYLPTVA